MTFSISRRAAERPRGRLVPSGGSPVAAAVTGFPAAVPLSAVPLSAGALPAHAAAPRRAAGPREPGRPGGSRSWAPATGRPRQ